MQKLNLSAVQRMYAFTAEMKELIQVDRDAEKTHKYYIKTKKGRCTFKGHVISWYGRHPTYHIHWLIAQRRGAGRCALQKVCELADKHQIRLHLFPVPIAGGRFIAELDQLLRFYESFGFHKRKVKNVLKMWRRPQPQSTKD